MDTMSNTSLRIALVFVFLGCMYTMMMWNSEINQKIIQEKENQVLNNKVDSLQNELLNNQIELGRYKVAYEIFLERNPKAASQYNDIISNETE